MKDKNGIIVVPGDRISTFDLMDRLRQVRGIVTKYVSPKIISVKLDGNPREEVRFENEVEILREKDNNASEQLIIPTTIKAQSLPAVNDHTCPTCSNKRVSRAETQCWWCGELL